ncbi:MAG TPA: 30S ribosomal protein S18 [Rhabdochlamydiaceae bacterium]|nr:30S ribosomal protein S18 [Rhabdochlamydiaceae bacterium]
MNSHTPTPENIFVKKKKNCPFTAAGVRHIDYKDVNMLSQFITERGKIIPRRITGVSFYHQKLLAKAVKRARHMALLPFVATE